MTTLSLRLSPEMEQKLAEEARLDGRSRSELVRDVLAAYLEAQDKRRFIAGLLAEAKRLTRAETAGVAEEFLEADNEALELAEGSAPKSV
ncbi:MAG: ribbon-helix-helix protein, CopG family [Gammaproteobacteria bacterium]